MATPLELVVAWAVMVPKVPGPMAKYTVRPTSGVLEPASLTVTDTFTAVSLSATSESGSVLIERITPYRGISTESATVLTLAIIRALLVVCPTSVVSVTVASPLESVRSKLLLSVAAPWATVKSTRWSVTALPSLSSTTAVRSAVSIPSRSMVGLSVVSASEY